MAPLQGLALTPATRLQRQFHEALCTGRRSWHLGAWVDLPQDATCRSAPIAGISLAGWLPNPCRPGRMEVLDGTRRRLPVATAIRLYRRVPHHLPDLHHRPVGVYRHAARHVAAHGRRALPDAGALLDAHVRRVLRHGRRLRHRPVLPVRHQLEPLLRGGRQRRRPADRLRGAHRLFPRGDLPRHHAVRLEAGAAVAARPVGDPRRDRHGDLGVLDHLRQFVDAISRRPRRARWHRLSGRLDRGDLQSDLRLAAGAHGDRRLPDHGLRRARRRRPLFHRRQVSRPRSHHAQDGHRHGGGAGAGAIAHRRPARP